MFANDFGSKKDNLIYFLLRCSINFSLHFYSFCESSSIGKSFNSVYGELLRVQWMKGIQFESKVSIQEAFSWLVWKRSCKVWNFPRFGKLLKHKYTHTYLSYLYIVVYKTHINTWTFAQKYAFYTPENKQTDKL